MHLATQASADFTSNQHSGRHSGYNCSLADYKQTAMLQQPLEQWIKRVLYVPVVPMQRTLPTPSRLES
jgi:hypothetical protein